MFRPLFLVGFCSAALAAYGQLVAASRISNPLMRGNSGSFSGSRYRALRPERHSESCTESAETESERLSSSSSEEEASSPVQVSATGWHPVDLTDSAPPGFRSTAKEASDIYAEIVEYLRKGREGEQPLNGGALDAGHFPASDDGSGPKSVDSAGLASSRCSSFCFTGASDSQRLLSGEEQLDAAVKPATRADLTEIVEDDGGQKHVGWAEVPLEDEQSAPDTGNFATATTVAKKGRFAAFKSLIVRTFRRIPNKFRKTRKYDLMR